MADELRPLDVSLAIADVDDWHVESLRAVERLSHVYRIDLEVTHHGHAHDLEERLLGETATLRILGDERNRTFYGVVVEITARGHAGHDADHTRYRLEIAPRAWLLGLSTRSRVFQDMRVDQVIQRVLAPYHIPMRCLLKHTYPRRPYCTQYEETDLAFLRRITAEEGIFFYFEHPNAGFDSLLGEASGAIRSALAVLPEGLGDLARQFTAARELMVFADDKLWYPPMARTEDEALAHLENLGRQLTSEAVRRVPGVAGELLGEVAGIVPSSCPTLEMRSASGALSRTRDSIQTFERRLRMRPVASAFRQFDPRRPHAPMSAERREHDHHDAMSAGFEKIGETVAAAARGEDVLAAATPDVAELEAFGAAALEDVLWRERRMETYEHHNRYLEPEWEHDKEEPTRILEAARRRHDVASGDSICPWLTPAHRFLLAGHELAHLDREWVPIAVTHELSERDGSRVYHNRFECVPATVSYRPARPRRRVVQSCSTGIVTGNEPISTDEEGRVQVRFHWDRTPGNLATTCWLRVAQQWSGPGLGAQFLPRVGHEVLVSFEDGDPDKPIVTAALYNNVHRHPFELPEERSKSGWRTRTPGGDGFNELSFDDADERERIHLRAQKDLDIHVQHDRSATIERHDRVRVKDRSELCVEGDRHEELRRIRDVRVGGDERVRIEGQQQHTMVGQAALRYEGGRVLCVEGSDDVELRGSRSLHARGDVTQRHDGNFTQLVGSSEGQRNHSVRVEGDGHWSASGALALTGDGEIVLRSGDSSIRIAPDKIVLSSPEVLVSGEDAHARLRGGEITLLATDKVQAKADTIVLASSGAAVGLTSEAAVEGSRILLNSPGNAEDAAESSATEPTTIELVDQTGTPIARQPFRIVQDDGSETRGVLDDRGRATLFLDADANVVFDGLTDVEAG